MSKLEKLFEKFKTVPKDLTWSELVKILNHLGYFEIAKRESQAVQEENLQIKIMTSSTYTNHTLAI